THGSALPRAEGPARGTPAGPPDERSVFGDVPPLATPAVDEHAHPLVARRIDEGLRSRPEPRFQAPGWLAAARSHPVERAIGRLGAVAVPLDDERDQDRGAHHRRPDARTAGAQSRAQT